MYKITIPKPSDASGIQHLMQTTWRATYPNSEFGITKKMIRDLTSDSTSQAEINKLAQKLENIPSRTTHFIIKDQQRVVANCVVSKGVLRQLYILPEYQNKGLGSMLMKKIDAKEVYVATYNHKALQFYKTHGYKTAEASEATFGDVTIPQVRMYK